MNTCHNRDNMRRRGVMIACSLMRNQETKSTATAQDASSLAIEQNDRLQNCGLHYHENQSNNRGYVGPPVRRTNPEPRYTVQPLTRVTPKPGMEIHAVDGERYTLPLNFVGTWFDVVSPKNRRLIDA